MTGGAIYVDDSGNPGAETGTDFLPSSRRSWTAVIIPGSIAQSVARAMDILLDGVLGDFGAREVHFTEIYSGKRVWKDVEWADRAKLFDLTASIMSTYALPVVHQTISAATLLDHPEIGAEIRARTLPDWNMKDDKHVGLLMLCSQVSRFCRTMRSASVADFGEPMPMFADEGLSGPGVARTLPNWGEAIEGPEVRFVSSEEMRGIQLADFAAFTVMRAQWLVAQRIARGSLKPSDATILKAVGKLNIVNLPSVRVSAADLDRATYERWIGDDRLAKGLEARLPK